jgi:putative ABC transport system substrate-binding protein
MATAADDADSQGRFQAFIKSLDKAGWTQGKNVRIESRWFAGDPDRVRAYAAELLSLRPNIILANTALALEPLKTATDSIPIVFVLVYDPATSGFVSSLAHPEGNITGPTLGELSLGGKMLEALNQVAPEIDHVSL